VAERALALAAKGDHVGIHALACAHSGLHRTSALGGPDDATITAETPRFVEEAVRISLDASTPWRMYCGLVAGLAYTGLGAVTATMDDRTEPHLRAALDAAGTLDGFDGLRAALREYLGLCLFVRGDPAGALAVVEPTAGEAVFPMLGVSQHTVHGLSLAALGRPGEAREVLRAGRDTLLAIDVSGGLGIAALDASGLAVIAEDWERASLLLAAGSASVRRSPLLSFLYFRHRDLVRSALPADRCRALRDEGRTMGPGRALAELFD
jgi:hypothetical protein